MRPDKVLFSRLLFKLLIQKSVTFYMKKYFLAILFPLSILTGCSGGGGDSSSSTSYTYSCYASGKSYSGCCSGHGGAKLTCNNLNPSQYDFRSDGKLVCADETVSPSCTW
jgi:hypothetical protein